MQDNFDSPWKEAIGRHFRCFLQFFFPELEVDIDWAQGYQLLDSELQAVVRAAEHGRRHADSLIRVQRLSGESQLVLIHIEVQSQYDSRFSRRMLLYHTRLRDRFDQPVCSLALLGDGRRSWRPDHYVEALWGCQLALRFPIRKLLDYPDWASETVNPFAWLTAAHLQAQATRNHPALRAEIKFRLIRGLYSCGLTRAQLLELFRLLDWVLALPPKMEYDFKRDLARFEEEHQMVYVSSVERIARKEGLEAGRAEGLAKAQREACEAIRQSIQERLEQRWGPVETKFRSQLAGVKDFQRLLGLHVLAATAASMQEWAAELKA
ncbi:MAG: transposase [Candidatus Eremiobacteraeota bacterium]|nr:transposase [Candidatus Eremiobacteraeota bacterium]MCW5866128.1 transposase [Candidatus Eremiobacteraeota bacterium]